MLRISCAMHQLALLAILGVGGLVHEASAQEVVFPDFQNPSFVAPPNVPGLNPQPSYESAAIFSGHVAPAGTVTNGTLSLEQSRIGQSVRGSLFLKADFNFGDAIPVPSGVDLDTFDLATNVVPASKVSLVENVPSNLDDEENEIDKDGYLLFASDPGFFTIDWDGPGGDDPVQYLTSTEPAKPTVRIYLTQNQLGNPFNPPMPSVDLSTIDTPRILYNTAIPDEYDPGTPGNPGDDYEPLFVDETGSLQAREFAGLNSGAAVLLTYELVGVYAGFEIVEVLRRVPDSSLTGNLAVDLGDEFEPSYYPPVDQDDLRSFGSPYVRLGAGVPATPNSFQDPNLVYWFQEAGSAKNDDLFAIRPTTDASDDSVEVVWRLKSLLDIEWPYEYDTYAVTWPDINTEAAKYQLYARGSAPDEPGRGITLEDNREDPITINGGDVTLPYQEPEGHAELLGTSFSTDDEGRSLLAYTPGSPRDIFFERVRAVFHDDAGVFPNLDEEETFVGSEITEASHMGPDPGYIYRPEGDRYAPDIYDGLDAGGVNEAAFVSTGQIIPVNTSASGRDYTLEVWWANLGPESGVQWFSDVRRYDAVWPTIGVDTVVISEQVGTGPIDDGAFNVWSLYYQNDDENPGFNPNDEHAIIRGEMQSSNSDCSSPVPLTEGVIVEDGFFAASSSQANSVCGDDDAFDLWYTYTSTATSNATITLCSASAGATISVYDGCGGLLLDTDDDEVGDACTSTAAACDDGSGLDLTIPVAVGESYLVRVATPSIEGGDFELSVTLDGGGARLGRVARSGGQAIFPLRSDLGDGGSGSSSEPYILMKYLEDATPGEEVWSFKIFEVAATRPNRPFSDWDDLEYPFDKYEAPVWEKKNIQIDPPYPLSLLGYCDATDAFTPLGADQNWFEDRKERHWVLSAGQEWDGDDNPYEAGETGLIDMSFFYPVLAGFYFPDGYELEGSAPQVGDHVPWLDLLSSGTPGSPELVQLTTFWPDDAPVMDIGETLVTSKRGLPAIQGQLSAEVVYEQAEVRDGDMSAQLIDYRKARFVELDSLPDDINQVSAGGTIVFPDLNPLLKQKISYDPILRRLSVKGVFKPAVLGDDYILLNVLTDADVAELDALSGEGAWKAKVAELGVAAADPIVIEDSSLEFDGLALSTAFANAGGFVTLAFGDNDDLGASPVSMQLIFVRDMLAQGEIAYIAPDCPFDERYTLKHKGDFAGTVDDYVFAWEISRGGGANPPPENDPSWECYSGDCAKGEAGADTLVVDIELGASALDILSDNYFRVRYARDPGPGQDVPVDDWSPYTDAQLGEGWIKRVIGEINPFNQATGGAIESKEDLFLAYSKEIDTIVSMISQAGPRWTGSVPLNCENLDAFGLIEIYETVLGRGIGLSIQGAPPVDYEPANQALLLAAGRIADLYMLLGNEAFADATDPTIGIGNDVNIQAPALHAFTNMTDSLIEEELALLRGRDDSLQPPIDTPPVHNRLVWNFTGGDGEPIYVLNYDIRDQDGNGIDDAVGGSDGVLDEADAKILYPQGHGDAWGHYLSAISSYYRLIRDPNYTWVPRAESVLVGGQPVSVDFLDERKFAKASAAKARTGAEIANLTYRDDFVEDPNGQWQGYIDDSSDRAWGVSEWASRAGMGAFFDWTVANALIPAEDTENTGIEKVDRTTVTEIDDIAAAFAEIDSQVAMADAGLNPLGLATNVVPFDISPCPPSDPTCEGHFEQIYGRAVQAMNNAIVTFNNATASTQALRRQADEIADFQNTVEDREADFNNRLIEIFGEPYAEDIGGGKTYAPGYEGPDLYHYMIVEASELTGQDEGPTIPFQIDFTEFAVQDGGGLGETQTTVVYEVSQNGFGVVKPEDWTSIRTAPGELQFARSDLLQARARFDTALIQYDNLLAQIDDQIELLEAQFALNAAEINILNDGLATQQALNEAIARSRARQLEFRTKGRIAQLVANATAEALPTAAGLSNDVTAPIRSAIRLAGTIINENMSQDADSESLAELDHQQAQSIAQSLTNLKLTTLRGEFAVLQQVKQLEQLVRQEVLQRLEVYTVQESLQQTANRYLATLARGERLWADQIRFRKQTAADVQQYRYEDMAFRVFRNDALEKYRAQFDLAARYVYLAAKAYDFETNLLGTNTLSGQRFLTDIVGSRALGLIQDGQPVTGGSDPGLSDPLAKMIQNWQVLESSFGFNNPQTETNRFSLRSELFRTQTSEVWRDTLASYVVPDILTIPEFERYGIPFSPAQETEPGIVIPMSSTINFGENFFGWPAGGGDSFYDSTNFATKIRTVGVWFSNYNSLTGSGMTNTPRVYLIPVGSDVLRSPQGDRSVTREWQILDQRIPPPFPISTNDLDDDFIPLYDDTQFGGLLFNDIRRFNSFRAYHDSGSFNEAETINNTRLIGRSVWNTRWLLVIPAGTLHSDRAEGLARFIYGREQPDGTRDGNGVSDIKIFFQTYAFSGVK